MESKNEKLFLFGWNCCCTVQSVANSSSTASDTIACEPSNYGTSSTFNCDVLEMSTRKQTSSSLTSCQQQRQHICMNWYFAEVNEQKILISFQCRRPTNDQMSLVLPHFFGCSVDEMSKTTQKNFSVSIICYDMKIIYDFLWHSHTGTLSPGGLSTPFN